MLRAVDCITVPAPDVDSGIAFYVDSLGQQLLWRNDELGQAGLALPDADAEIVLTTRQPCRPAWLVASAEQPAEAIRVAGGRIITEPSEIPVGRIAVVADPFDNMLVLLDLSKGHYVIAGTGAATGTTSTTPSAPATASAPEEDPLPNRRSAREHLTGSDARSPTGSIVPAPQRHNRTGRR